jgi:hypothetical protein
MFCILVSRLGCFETPIQLTCIRNPLATVCAAAHAAWANTCPPYVPLSPPVGEYAFTMDRNVQSSIFSNSMTLSKGSTCFASVKYGRTTILSQLGISMAESTVESEIATSWLSACWVGERGARLRSYLGRGGRGLGRTKVSPGHLRRISDNATTSYFVSRVHQYNITFRRVLLEYTQSCRWHLSEYLYGSQLLLGKHHGAIGDITSS